MTSERSSSRYPSRRAGPSIPGPIVQPALIPMVAVLLVAPQLLGGVFPWAVAMICLMAGAAGVLSAKHIDIISHKRQQAKLLDWTMVAVLGWTVLQLLPLPAGLVEMLVPESVEAWRANARLYGEAPPSWMPMSLDPGATRVVFALSSPGSWA